MTTQKAIYNVRNLRNRKLTQGRVYTIGNGLALAVTITNQFIVTWGDHGHVLHVASNKADALNYAESLLK